eukprot:CAMPEP_0118663050 /NCGR_PEP_ID=MMETSP0785-20121206/17182_1 /TAXON_ID=91992 /ORGANISM="Bolidomonas pacifica, Strain CCMP 1866" /LENGTH=277 /DNA_ID=CAMNT_0006556683 /DNA_START=73 /DNA_END=902 /DNA_ORIENTATION=-
MASFTTIHQPQPTGSTYRRDIFGGFTAGVVGTVIGYPLDTIKTRMQTGSSGGGGIFAVGRRILQTEGFPAFYKGIGTPLLSLSILNTLNFTSYNHFKRVFGGDNATNGGIIRCVMAGVVAGPIASVVSTPEHLIKTQMQIDNTSASPKYTSGSLSALRKISSTHGIRSVFLGHTSNTVRESCFLGIYFGCYEVFRALLPEWKVSVPIAGGLAGAAGWVGSYPLDCIKANIQGSLGGPSRSILSTGRDILKERGIRGLYSGLGPSLMRAFLVSGTRFS